MGINLERRLGRLESDTSQRQRVFLWWDYSKTYAETIAGRFPQGVPENVDVHVLTWVR